jgi:tetratricopeptide (TPR) repeat protein
MTAAPSPTAASLYVAAQSALAAGQTERATELLDQALADAAGDLRVDVLCAQARLKALTGGDRALAERLVEEAELADRPMRARLLVESAYLRLYTYDGDTVAVARQAHAAAADADEVTRARAAIILGGALALAGEAEESARYLTGHVDLLRVTGTPQESAHLLNHLTVGLASLERYDEAQTLCRRHVRVLRAVGADGVLPMALCLLANSAYFTADFDVMETAATEALDLARSGGQAVVQGFAAGCLGLALAVKGEHERAREQANAALALLTEGGALTLTWLPRYALAMAAVGAGEWQEARTILDEFGGLPGGMSRRPGLLHWRADHVEALWRTGRTDEARAALDEFLALSGMGPWDRATSLRVRALLAPEGEAEGLFAQALAAHDRASSPFERARTELCWGEWEAGRGRPDAARAPLERAHRGFAEVEAWAWRRRAAELRDDDAPEPDAPPRRPAPATRVRAFGPLTVTRHGVPSPVPLDQPGRVLHYLVAAGGVMHVDQLAAMLWPGADLNGSARLRNLVARVRQVHGPVVVRQGVIIRWAEGVEVDVHHFDELARRALRLRVGPEAAALASRAVELYRDDLTPMERSSHEVAIARDRLRRSYVGMLDLLAEEELRSRHPEAAADLLRRARDAEPSDEVRHVKLATVLLDHGDLRGARAALAEAGRAAATFDWPVSERVVELEERLATALAASTARRA